MPPDPRASALAELKKADFMRRLMDKDPSLWKKEGDHQKIIRNSLGWLTLPDAMAAGLGPIRSFIAEIRKENFKHAVVLGMGGSSLGCEVYRNCLPEQTGYPKLEILDSTNPGAVSGLAARLDLKRTLFIAASKSGSTIEPNCLLAYFYDKIVKDSAAKAGNQFMAITDPGTSMEKLARKLSFRKIFLNPTDIGGRYSVLSLFGLVPAALMGADVEQLLDRTRAFAATAIKEEPILNLGAFLGGHAKAGRDKLTLSLSPRLESLGLWIEQLVAESTGKEGRGILPVMETLGPAASYGCDRVFVSITLGGETPEAAARLRELEKAGHPVLRLPLKDVHELGAQFYLWEAATAAAGFILGVNPFDQPNVQQAKEQTKQLLSNLHKGALPAEKFSFSAGSIAAFADDELLDKLKAARSNQLPIKEVLSAHLERLRPGDYCAILVYLDYNQENRRALESFRGRIRKLTTAPVTVSVGPRYLHSTGQLYKGGSSQGLFIEISAPDAVDLPIPGEPFTFGTLHRAQARGDFYAMREAGRRILRLDLGPAGQEHLKALLNAVTQTQTCRN